MFAVWIVFIPRTPTVPRETPTPEAVTPAARKVAGCHKSSWPNDAATPNYRFTRAKLTNAAGKRGPFALDKREGTRAGQCQQPTELCIPTSSWISRSLVMVWGCRPDRAARQEMMA
jgi:hypothetical protein